MRCITLLTVLVLAIMVVCSRAGKVKINGACVDCHGPGLETTTHKSTPAAHGGRGRQTTTTTTRTTAKPKSKSNHKSKKADDDDDDWNMSLGDFTLDQRSNGGQHISGGHRHKRQRQVILTDGGYGGGGWSGGGGGGGFGGRVTTIDSRGYPGTVVRNDDCVGCNIRG